jgi:hypothetical protein
MGREGTGAAGTDTAATTIWLGTVLLQDMRELTWVEESIGNYAGYGSTFIAKSGSDITFEEAPADFEQIIHVFEAGIAANVSTSASGSLFVRNYQMSSTSAQTPMTYSLEVGDNEDVDESQYCFCDSFSLSGAPDEAVMLNSHWMGRVATAASFTASLSRPTIERMIFNTGRLYIDTNTAGTTQITSSFRSFNLNVTTGFKPVQTADGNKFFTFVKMTDPEVTLDITAEHDSSWDSAGEKANWRSQTERLLRLAFQGSSGRRLHIDLAGKWTTFSATEEEDGNSVITGSFKAYYSTTETFFADFEIANLTNAIP